MHVFDVHRCAFPVIWLSSQITVVQSTSYLGKQWAHHSNHRDHISIAVFFETFSVLLLQTEAWGVNWVHIRSAWSRGLWRLASPRHPGTSRGSSPDHNHTTQKPERFWFCRIWIFVRFCKVPTSSPADIACLATMHGTKPHLTRKGCWFNLLVKWVLRVILYTLALGLPGVKELAKLTVWDKTVVCFVRQAGTVGWQLVVLGIGKTN